MIDKHTAVSRIPARINLSVKVRLDKAVGRVRIIAVTPYNRPIMYSAC